MRRSNPLEYQEIASPGKERRVRNDIGILPSYLVKVLYNGVGNDDECIVGSYKPSYQRISAFIRVQFFAFLEGGADLGQHARVALTPGGGAQGLPGVLAAEAAKRPGGMASHQRLGVIR